MHMLSTKASTLSTNVFHTIYTSDRYNAPIFLHITDLQLLPFRTAFHRTVSLHIVLSLILDALKCFAKNPKQYRADINLRKTTVLQAPRDVFELCAILKLSKHVRSTNAY